VVKFREVSFLLFFFVYRAEILIALVLLYYLHQLILVGGIYFIYINQGEDM
jgi:hypothetical protein